ncbi:MAG: nucleotidyltransferase domain-containing protein [Gemmatimonadota bacterium]
MTNELDVCYARDRANQTRLTEALRELRARLRGVPEDVPFVLDERTLAAGDHFTFVSVSGNLDGLGTPAGTGGYDDLARTAEEMRIGERVVKVAAVEDLIRSSRPVRCRSGRSTGTLAARGNRYGGRVDQTRALPAETEWAIGRWAADAGCRLCVLFGSTASGRGGVEGDVDLALAFDPLPEPRRRLAIIGELQDLSSPRRADVVFLHRDTDPVLRFEIFRGGRPLHEARPGLFVNETVRALALYEDALPFRRALRRSLGARGSGRSP